MAIKAVAKCGVNIALACRRFQNSETCDRYSPLLSDANEEIADWLARLTANKRTWGFGLCFLYLRKVQGYGWNNISLKPSRRRRTKQLNGCRLATMNDPTWASAA